MKPTKKHLKNLVTAIHNAAEIERDIMKYGIDIRATYVAVDYRPHIRIDRLKRQKIESAVWDQAWPLRNEYEEISRQIDPLRQGMLVRARVDSRSIAVQTDAVLRAIQMCQTSDRMLERARKSRLAKIKKLQQRQAQIIAEIRKLNGAVVVARRRQAQEKRDREQAALEGGRFWECSEETLKDFFHVPMKPRKLVDVSERHRAALFVHLELEDYYVKQLVPSEQAYLCGIDDNGEQWGFRITRYPRWTYDSSVEEAMAECWHVPMEVVKRSYRQGEVLVWPETVPPGTTLTPKPVCDVAPSHTMKSKTLTVNGTRFMSFDPIRIEHPTHGALELPPGEYRFAIHTNGDVD